ncbi:MAG: hypothetical protein WAU86_19105 [Oricola sp.]
MANDKRNARNIEANDLEAIIARAKRDRANALRGMIGSLFGR